MTLFKVILAVAVVIVLVVLALGFLRSYQTQHSANEVEFLKGEALEPLPDGFYKGSVNVETSWLGKKFDAQTKTGINVLNENGQHIEKYPFKLYIAKGLADRDLDVIKIDYDVPQNPLWLRLILDEIVELEPGKYLGKLHLRLLPGMSFVLGYFRLEK